MFKQETDISFEESFCFVAPFALTAQTGERIPAIPNGWMIRRSPKSRKRELDFADQEKLPCCGVVMRTRRMAGAWNTEENKLASREASSFPEKKNVTRAPQPV